MIGNAAYLESRILSADPIELIAILYEHAVLSVRDARECLAKRDVAGRAAKIAKAIAITGELESSLDHSVGGEIPMNLARLYQYIRERLTTANIMKEDAPLADVEGLLNTLAEGWDGVRSTGKQQVSTPPPVSTPRTESLFSTSFSTSFLPEATAYSSSNAWTA
jgi:flagellar protein FliS